MAHKNVYLNNLAINAYSIETLTPGIATAILMTHGYKQNRKLSASRVKQYASDMAQGKWKGSLGEPITLGKLPNGNYVILNGHHRLAAASSLADLFPGLDIEFKFMVEPCKNMKEVKEKYDFFDCAESSRKSQECLMGSESFARGSFQNVSDTQQRTLILAKFPKAYLKYVYAFGKVPTQKVRSAASFRDHESYIATNQDFLKFFLTQIDFVKNEQKNNTSQALDKSILSAYTSNFEVMAVLYLIHTECGVKGKQFIELLFDRGLQNSTLPNSHVMHRYNQRLLDMLHRTGASAAVKGNDRTKGVMFLLITLWNKWSQDHNAETRTMKGFPLPKTTDAGISALTINGARGIKGTISDWRLSLSA